MSHLLNDHHDPIVWARIASPLLLLLTTSSLIFTKPNPVTPPLPSPVVPVVVASNVPRRGPLLLFLSFIAFTYFLDGATFILFSIINKHWPPSTVGLFNAIVGLSAYAGLSLLSALKETQGVQVWSLRRIRNSMIIAFILDVTISIFLVTRTQRGRSRNPFIALPLENLLHIVFPAIRTLLLLLFLAVLANPHVVYRSVSQDGDTENPESHDATQEANISTGLLSVPGGKYGTFAPSDSSNRASQPSTRPPTPSSSFQAQSAKEKSEVVDPSWSEVYRRLKRLFPYLWPSKSRSLQLIGLVCIIVLIATRVVNAIVPFVAGELISIFEHRSERPLWIVLGVYVFLRFLQGSGGLPAVRETLWIPVMQYSDREMSQLSFDHLLNLSFSFHTKRKTGEILRVLDRGAAINRTFELLLFNLVPTFIDIGVALVVFCFTFDWTLALVILLVMTAYVSASVIITQWRTKMRRQMNERDIVTRGIHTDCLLNYETVKYFCGEEHEGDKYREAIREYQAMEYKVYFSLNVLNLTQNFIITLGLLIGSIIVARRIVLEDRGSGDFVIFITYIAQLYAPLNQLGTVYRAINQSLIDTEKLLMLLNEPTDINDKPDAPDLVVEDGEIEFENVSFSYDGSTPALRDVSFKVPKNSSVALVGESGAGKSTILRLLFRFYDLGEGQGRILIDGRDIRDVTQKSLRQAIGVVPQDSVLFNTSIGYNIGYGKFGASEEEIQAAALSAQMHDRIVSFPKGYETTVGERGVRLSGGEKQRVAIARTLLKNPPILLLDEATSALDTSTERDIQKALQNLMTGRSSLSIAHRLSTIASADIILVLKDGQIVERGSHKELLALDGVFAAMWADQISTAEGVAATIETDIQGYVTTEQDEAQPENVLLDTTTEEPADIPTLAGEVVDEPEVAQPKPEVISPIAFPTSESSDVIAAPVEAKEDTQTVPEVESSSKVLAFPTSVDDSTSGSAPVTPGPGVTFDTTGSETPRSGTADAETEPKRKRISSQNFQRLARRISLNTRKQPSISSIIPDLLRRESSPKVSLDGGSGSVRSGSVGSGEPESPVPSVAGESKSKKKLEKKRKSVL